MSCYQYYIWIFPTLDYGIRIFRKKEKYVFPFCDHTLWMVLVGHPPGIYSGEFQTSVSIFSRRLRDVLWGLSSLFSDLLNFEDPLNIEAADHFRSDQEGFRTKVRDWVVKYAKR